MEIRYGRIYFQKSRSGRSAKIALSLPWLRKMEISEEEKEIILIFDENEKEIIIRKQ